MNVPKTFKTSQILFMCLGIFLIVNRFLDNSFSMQLTEFIQNYIYSYESCLNYVTLAILIIASGFLIYFFIKNRKNPELEQSMQKELLLMNVFIRIGALLILIKLLYVA